MSLNIKERGRRMSLSKIDSKLSLEYLTKEKENLYFERKRAQIALRDLANEIASFSNSNGGIIVVGITDDGKVEGFNPYGIEKLNGCQKVVTNFLKPTPKYRTELVDIKNDKGEDDKLLLFHIEPELNCLIRNNKDEVYCRQGDSSIKLNVEQTRSLEYDRKERDFEA